MKLSTIATTLALAAPTIHALGGLRKLADPKGESVLTNMGYTAEGRADIDWGSITDFQDLLDFDLDNLNLPTMDELNGVYDGFCSLCSLGELLNLDVQFCFLCELDLGGDGGDGDPIGGIGDIACFSGISTVQVENQGSVTMKDLQVGAKVLTGSGGYEAVYAFGHKHATESAEFLQFNNNLEMTGSHLVFVEGKSNPVRADSIKTGDVLQGDKAKVTEIKTIKRDGVYTPLTPSGTVVVNGITASSYISLQKNADEFVELQGGISTFMSIHNFIHMALSPFRMFTMGVSSSMGNTYTEEGIPTFAAAGIDLAKWADSQNIVVQAIFFLAFFAIAGASMVIENTFGPSMAPLAIAAGVGAYALMNKNNISFRANKIKSV